MKLSVAAIAALLSATAFAAPLEERAAPAFSPAGLAPAGVPDWTIRSLKRVCNAADTSCVWTFAINTHVSPVVPCQFTVTGTAKVPASENPNSTGHVCGPFTVASGWSGQFGSGNGFTTLAVAQSKKRLIAYPSYNDAELEGGQVVKPNKSFKVYKT